MAPLDASQGFADSQHHRVAQQQAEGTAVEVVTLAGGLPVFDDAPSWGAVPAGEEAASLQAATVAAINALQWVGSVWEQVQEEEVVRSPAKEEDVHVGVTVGARAVNGNAETDRVLHEALQAARQREAQWYGQTNATLRGQHTDVLEGRQAVRACAVLLHGAYKMCV